MLTKITSALFFTVLLLATSCSNKKNNAEDLIPSDAKAVFAINAGQLMGKLAKAGLSADSFDTILTDTTTKDNKPVTNFSTTATQMGINLMKPIFVAYSKSNNALNSNALLRIIATLGDENKFSNFLNNQKVKTTKSGGLTFAEVNDMVIGYDSKFVVAVQQAPSTLLKNNTDNSAITPADTINNITTEQLQLAVINTFKAKTESITTNKNYTNLAVANNDVKIWINQEYLIDNVNSDNQFTQIGTRIFKDLFAGSSTTCLINFDNGKINAKSQTYFNPEVSSLIKNVESKQIDFELIKNYPGSKLNAIVGFAVTPKLLYEFAKYIKQDGILNVVLAELKMSTTDVFNALSGDAVAILADVNNANAFTQQNQPALNAAIILKVNNSTVIQKILQMPDIAKNLKRNGDLYIIQPKANVAPWYISISTNNIIISTNQKIITSYINKISTNTFATTGLSKLQGKSAGYYIDVNSLSSIIAGSQFTSLLNTKSTTDYKNIANIFTQTYATTGAFTNNYIEATATLELNNSEINSLAHIIKNVFKLIKSVRGNTANTLLPSDDEKIGDIIKPMKVD